MLQSVLILLLCLGLVVAFASGWRPRAERDEDTWLRSSSNRRLVFAVAVLLLFAAVVVLFNRL